MTTMRAICYDEYGNADVLRLIKTQIPKLANDEVLIRVHAASLNPFDWKLRNGMLQTLLEVQFPVTPGRDGCGEIVAFGKDVRQAADKTLQEGQRVSFISSRLQNGAFAEYVAVKAADFIAPAPAEMTAEQCAALPLVGLSAWIALVETVTIKAGMRILVHGGSGGVGSIAIQIARHSGAEVFSTCSTANIERVNMLGATAIAYDSVDFENEISACDIVFDTIGGQVHEKSYRVLKPGGCLVYLLAAPFKDLSDDFDVSTRQAVILNQSQHLRKVMRFAAQGILQPGIGQSLSLTEFKKAFQLGETGKARGKIVLTVDE